MKSILDKSFRYTPSAETDLRKTFARMRRKLKAEQAEAERRKQANAAEVAKKVKPLKVGP